MNGQLYELKKRARLLNYPYQLEMVGWMLNHNKVHNHNMVDAGFICLSSNRLGDTRLQINEHERFIPAAAPPSFLMFMPGTELNTLQAGNHDELFFKYAPAQMARIADLVGPEIVKRPFFFFNGLSPTLLSGLRHELNHLDEYGAADRVDQLAVQIIGEIITRRLSDEQHTLSMKLHSIAQELLAGKSLTVLLKKYAMSRRSFYRAWQKFCNIPPHEYCLRQMLDNACSLLSQTDLPLMEVSQRCRFSSVSYFHQIFLRKLGETPGSYRRNHPGKLSAPQETEGGSQA